MANTTLQPANILQPANTLQPLNILQPPNVKKSCPCFDVQQWFYGEY